MLFNIGFTSGIYSSEPSVIRSSNDNQRPTDGHFLEVDRLEAEGLYLNATRLYISLVGENQLQAKQKFMSMLDRKDVNVDMVFNFCLLMKTQGHSGAAVLLGFMPMPDSKENSPRFQRLPEEKLRVERVVKHERRALSPVNENLTPNIFGNYPNHSSFGGQKRT